MRLRNSLVLLLLLLSFAVAGGCASRVVVPQPVNLTNNTGDSLGPSMAIDGEDNVHLVYYDDTLINNDIMYRVNTGNGAWSPETNASHNEGESFGPKLLASPEGNLYLVWQDDEFSFSYQVLLSSKAPEADWEDPVIVSLTEFDSLLSTIARDSDGAFHVVWTDITPGNWEILYSSSLDGKNWSTPENISNNEGLSSNPSLTIDTEDTLHLAWEDDTGGNSDILYTYKRKGDDWSDSENVSRNTGSSTNPRILSDAQGNLHLAWNDDTPGNWDIYYASRPRGGLWSKAENVSRTKGASGFPALALDSKGTLHLAWHDDTPGNFEVYHTTRPQGKTWAKPVNVSNSKGDSADVTMAIDRKDTVHLAWTDNTPGNWDIFYTALTAK
ncbi:MAG: hypothetical protein HY669_04520 [Chloroflexi bacterium]|nr:hypothetical protein [Chloroflexota bacterium]